jgi:hypothetical protein
MGGALLWCRLKPRCSTPRWTHVKSVCGSISRVLAGASELTRRRPARRISGQEIPAGVRLRSLRCSLGSAIKDVELGVEYRRAAAGILSAMLFLAAATAWSSERFRQSFAEIHRHAASASGLPKAEKTQTALPPATCETGASYNQGRQEAASLSATNVGNVAAALHAADLASAKTAADATDDLRLAAGCRPSGGAVDSPPQVVTSRMCASGSQDFMREAWLRRL